MTTDLADEPTRDDETLFWRYTGVFGTGHVSYAPGRLREEGPFTNPARMIEDIMGHDPDPTALGWRSESDFYAAVWMHAGWWDPAGAGAAEGRDT